MSEPQADQTTTSKKGDALITASIFLAATAILYLAIINDDWQDAYIHFRAGERVARGEVPYRDFFLFWFPGAPLALAAWFKLFGTGLAGLQLLQAVLAGASVTVGWLIARLTIPSPFRFAVPFVLAGTYVVGNQGMNHMSFSMPLALFAIWAALKAQSTASRRYCFLAGAAAGLSGMFTITTGAWLGAALVAVALLCFKDRLKSAAFVAAGGASVLLLLVVYLASIGVMREFIDSAIIWPRERYAPFHAGVGWGAWLPEWKMLNIIPAAWKVTWVLTLSLVWGHAYVLPLIFLESLAFTFVDKKRPERIVLLVCAAALLFSAFPNAAAMRLARLSTGLWILIVYELAALLSQRPRWMRSTATAVLIGLFAIVIPLQWSYANAFIKVQTPRGTARLQQISTFEYNALQKAIPAESRVAVMPEYRPAAWLLKFDNPTRYDTLTPVLYSPEQLAEAAQQLKSAGYPPVVYFASSELANIDTIRNSFGPSKYLDEWQKNAMSELLKDDYTPSQAGPVFVLTHKAD